MNVRLTLLIYLIREVLIEKFDGTTTAIICFDSMLAHTMTCKDAKTCSLHHASGNRLMSQLVCFLI